LSHINRSAKTGSGGSGSIPALSGSGDNGAAPGGTAAIARGVEALDVEGFIEELGRAWERGQ
jgi:hypothetical protein